MLDRITSMQMFIAVARRGSFVGGAADLGRSPAMASKHVQALEKHLGARLLNRTTRAIHLTEAGQAYLERITRIVEELEAIEEQIGRQSVEPKGSLAVAAPTSFGAFHLAPRIAEYMERYPGVQVRLILTDREVDLVDEGIDVAICIRELEDSSYVARRLGAVRMVICAAPGYLARRGAPATPAALADHNCLIFAESPTTPRADWLFAAGPGVRPVAVSGDLVANRGDAVRMAAVAGRGIVRLPEYMVRDDLAAQRLVAVLDEYEPPLRPIYAVYPHRELLASKVRTFVDYLVGAFAPATESARAGPGASSRQAAGSA